MALPCFNEPWEGIFFPVGFCLYLFPVVFVFLHKASANHWSSANRAVNTLKAQLHSF